jgi:hypothetical protein
MEQPVPIVFPNAGRNDAKGQLFSAREYRVKMREYTKAFTGARMIFRQPQSAHDTLGGILGNGMPRALNHVELTRPTCV